MDKNDGYLIMPRGLGKSRFIALAEIDFLYRTGRQSEEFVENWKERARKDELKSSDM